MDDAGNLYAGGGFTTAGGAAANSIAKWDGSNWSALDSGLGGDYHSDVEALAVDDVGNLYVGGSFDTAGGVYADNVAKWDGSDWSALGSGTGGEISALAVDGAGYLYAGGWFNSAGGVAANRVAKWNGSAWSALGSGMDGEVRALAVDGAGNLYAGGGFTTAGGVAANGIARWGGSAWSALGSGMGGGSVRALAVDGAGTLYAGGGFTTAGGVAAKSIAKWDGSAWSALGSAMHDWVVALAVDSAGNLYAGGDSATGGGGTAHTVAKWNGSTWSTLGTLGVESQNGLNALAVDDFGRLYAGGGFTTAGDKPSAYIARWEPNYELTLTKTGIGSGTVTSNPPGIDCGAACDADFSASTVVTLTAMAGALSTFAGWSGACADAGSCIVTMAATKAVTATFTAPGAVTPQASTMYYGPQLQVGGVVAAAAPVTVTKLVVFTGTVPAGIFLVGVEGSEPYAGEIAAGRLINRLLKGGCGAHSACAVVNCTVYAPDGTHTDFVVTSPVITDHVYLPHVRR